MLEQIPTEIVQLGSTCVVAVVAILALLEVIKTRKTSQNNKSCASNGELKKLLTQFQEELTSNHFNELNYKMDRVANEINELNNKIDRLAGKSEVDRLTDKTDVVINLLTNIKEQLRK